MWLQVINKVKVTYQGQGPISRLNQGLDQIEFIFKERYSYACGFHLNQMRSCIWNGLTLPQTRGTRINLSSALHECQSIWNIKTPVEGSSGSYPLKSAVSIRLGRELLIKRKQP